MLAAIAVITLSTGRTIRAEQPSPDLVAKLISQLGDDSFRTRERAAADLAKLGEPILPALRKAASAKVELEVKQRIELVIQQIDRAALEAEAKLWQPLDAPKQKIKDRMEKLLSKKPSLSDDQLSSAIYLLALGRSASAKEVEEAKKQFGEGERRPAKVLAFVRSHVQSKEFNADVATASARMLEIQAGLAKKAAATNLEIVNSSSKYAGEIAASLDKGVKGNEQLIDVAFLLTMSRFPKADEATQVITFLKKERNRATAITDIVWALMNSKEFLFFE
jgi:hypothetical protein